MRRWWVAVALLTAACSEPASPPSCAPDCSPTDAGTPLDAPAPSDAGHDGGPQDAGSDGGEPALDGGADASAPADASADAGRWWGDAECSPLPQAGCNAGEACFLRSVAGSGWVATCEPAGTFGSGHFCNYAPNQCAPGLFCFNSSCWRFCDVGTGECACASLEDPRRPNLGRCR